MKPITVLSLVLSFSLGCADLQSTEGIVRAQNRAEYSDFYQRNFGENIFTEILSGLPPFTAFGVVGNTTEELVRDFTCSE